MINRNGIYELELTDEILMNKLVRNGTDFSKFSHWYKQLNIEEKSALITALFELAYQAGINNDIINNTSEASSISKNETLIQNILALKNDIDSIEELILHLAPADRDIIFKYAVYLFGFAESNAYKICSKNENCNHWWHRDLLDSSVEQSIIEDSEYYLTSRKDDKKQTDI